jgi:hypothetical protein
MVLLPIAIADAGFHEAAAVESRSKRPHGFIRSAVVPPVACASLLRTPALIAGALDVMDKIVWNQNPGT